MTITITTTTTATSSPKPLPGVKAFTFDVFGTLVSWRDTVAAALESSISFPPPSSSSSSPTPTELANLWRASYSTFTTTYDPSRDPWKDVDTHHHESLISLLEAHRIPLPASPDLETLSRIWHFLPPRPDAPAGLRTLTRHYKTATLSNGNTSLLRDLAALGRLEFTQIISAEDFKAYKPNSKVYLGACEKLGGLEPKEVAMVAAHLGDLDAARKLGFRTVYLERSGEEGWGPDEERYKAAKDWVDVWVADGEGGLEEVVRRLGLVVA
ncbi:HAD-like domain-containing protein [Cladorrhinum samala]|uniref:HAD-like domain-containing protein n=1 Tax=Cladorrhinum samala TaxID=585594 RepID=A0AAV9HTG3_9PEZI|nr:HAD-like domain-containing protein [Cladorrhinum samala]